MMDAQAWIELGGLLFTIIGGAVYVEHRMGDAMPRDDFDKKMTEYREQVERKLDKILESIDANDQASRDSRHKLLDTVNELKLKVAVLADRAERR